MLWGRCGGGGAVGRWGAGVDKSLQLLQLSVPLVTSNVLNKLLASASNATGFIYLVLYFDG